MKESLACPKLEYQSTTSDIIDLSFGMVATLNGLPSFAKASCVGGNPWYP